jgi:predicted RNA-binding protein Jag
MEHTLSPFVIDFFTKLGIVTTSITVDQVWEDINIRVETPDSALLIGMHGKNIEVFQHLLTRMIERKTSDHIHVHLEVNDYMKLKNEKLYRFLDSKIAMVTSTGQSVRLPSLTPYERKKAHSYIADKNLVGLSSHSEWEGLDRALVLSYTGAVIPKSIPAIDHSTKTIPTLSTNLISDDGVGI